jgi:glycosyltransferase involved in cell wall biosynthesis
MNHAHSVPILAEKFNRSVSLVTWAYNEELLVEGFLKRAFKLLEEIVEDFEVVFVNDGSTDRTGDILDRFSQHEPRLKVIHNEKNLNVGLSSRTAFQLASKEYLFWQTVDWSYDIKNLILLKMMVKQNLASRILAQVQLYCQPVLIPSSWERYWSMWRIRQAF